MRQIIFLLTVSLLVISCGQNDTKKKELELKEKELVLKEKELNLREKDSAVSQNTSPQTETSFIGPGYYKVINDKTSVASRLSYSSSFEIQYYKGYES